jgi:hypothetical protein
MWLPFGSTRQPLPSTGIAYSSSVVIVVPSLSNQAKCYERSAYGRAQEANAPDAEQQRVIVLIPLPLPLILAELAVRVVDVHW